MILPVETYTFVLTRLRYLSAAATGIGVAFKPDGKTAVYCSDQVALCQQAWQDGLLVKFNEANLADGQMTTAYAGTHDKCVSVYACMKSLYRKDLTVTKAIITLPKQDRTPEETLARAKALVKLWEGLPNVPGTIGPMVVGDLTWSMFGSESASFDVKLSAARLASSKYSGELAGFHAKLDEWDNFVSAGATQGRALFKEGTPQRAFIDRIPTEPSTVAPGQAVITVAESPAGGEVFLAFEAPHGTSFEVWHKGPADSVFTQVADVLLPGEYAAAGLPEGAHEYYIVGVNSRGKGPASVPASISVAAAAAA